MLIVLFLNYETIKEKYEINIDQNLYQLHFLNEKSFENNEICKFFYIGIKKINLFSVNLTGYNIEKINSKNNSNILLITEYLKNIAKNIYDIGYLISKLNTLEKDEQEIHHKIYFDYDEIKKELEDVKKSNLSKRKDKVEAEIKQIDSKEDIKEQYIYILQLLVNDNTNKDLIIKYLDFLKGNKDQLYEIYSDNMELYENEVEYYLNILNSNEAKKYDKDKKGEKKELLDLFDELLKYNENNLNEFEIYLNNIDNPEDNIIYYNMPINSKNEELLFYRYNNLIKSYLFGLKKNIDNNIDYNVNLTENDEEKRANIKKEILMKELKTLQHKIELTRSYINEDTSDELIVRLLINLTIKSVDLDEYDFGYNLLTSKAIEKEEIVTKFEAEKKISIENKYKKDGNFKYLCLKNIEQFHDSKDYQNIIYNFKHYSNEHKIKYHFENVKKFYKKVLCKKCFETLYLTLFGDANDYPFKDEKFTDNFVETYFNFIPMKSQNFCGLTEKVTMITDILTFFPKATCKNDEEENILDHGLIIFTGNHEVGHNFVNISFYNENARIRIKTPRKNALIAEEEGVYIDYALYGRVLKFINLKQVLYLLNESNYGKHFLDFQKGFNNIQDEDLRLTGEFANIFKNISLENKTLNDNKNIYILTRPSYDREIKIDCLIKHDVVGKMIPEKMYEKILEY